jgi:hypothetical protein
MFGWDYLKIQKPAYNAGLGGSQIRLLVGLDGV